MDYASFLEWAIKGLTAGGVGLAVWHLKVISNIVLSMRDDLIRYGERMNSHKEKLDNHETRITRLEDKGR